MTLKREMGLNVYLIKYMDAYNGEVMSGILVSYYNKSGKNYVPCNMEMSIGFRNGNAPKYAPAMDMLGKTQYTKNAIQEKDKMWSQNKCL